jgi:hypothetical protein
MFLSQYAGRQLPAYFAAVARVRRLTVKHLASALTLFRAQASAWRPQIALAALRLRRRVALSNAALEPSVARLRAQNAQYRADLGAAAARMNARAVATRLHIEAAATRIRAQLTAVDSRLAASTRHVQARLAPHAEAALIRVRTREFRVASLPYLAIGLLSVSAGLMIATVV